MEDPCGLEETIANRVVAVTVAGFAALIIYGCVGDVLDGDTILRTAGTGAVVMAIGFAASFLRGWGRNAPIRIPTLECELQNAFCGCIL